MSFYTENDYKSFTGIGGILGTTFVHGHRVKMKYDSAKKTEWAELADATATGFDGWVEDEQIVKGTGPRTMAFDGTANSMTIRRRGDGMEKSLPMASACKFGDPVYLAPGGLHTAVPPGTPVIVGTALSDCTAPAGGMIPYVLVRITLL